MFSFTAEVYSLRVSQRQLRNGNGNGNWILIQYQYQVRRRRNEVGVRERERERESKVEITTAEPRDDIVVRSRKARASSNK